MARGHRRLSPAVFSLQHTQKPELNTIISHIVACSAIAYLPALAFAVETGSNSWEIVLTKISTSLTGPVAYAISIMAIFLCGMTMAFVDLSGGCEAICAGGVWFVDCDVCLTNPNKLLWFFRSVNLMVRGTILPVNRAMLRPIMIAGVEKRLALLNAMLAFPLIAATHCHLPAALVGEVLYGLLHVGFVLLSKHDPHLGKVLKCSTRYCVRPYFLAHSHPQQTDIWKARSVSRPK